MSWIIHWFQQDNGTVTPPIEPPSGYLPYRYVGPTTYLTLPAVNGINQYRKLTPGSTVSLPPNWDWTIRALERSLIVPAGGG